MEKGASGEASVDVNCPADAAYQLISDVTRMGEWSPECVSCQWIDGATGPVVGARFRGSNRHGVARWSNTPRVVVADPGREFAFISTDPFRRDMTRWSYLFEPHAGGTRITERYELLRRLPLYLRLTDRLVMGVNDRKADLDANIRGTLENIRAALTARAPGSG